MIGPGDDWLDEVGPDDWADAEDIIQRIRDAEEADAEQYHEDHKHGRE